VHTLTILGLFPPLKAVAFRLMVLPSAALALRRRALPNRSHPNPTLLRPAAPNPNHP
jgi:hypothetical protein